MSLRPGALMWVSIPGPRLSENDQEALERIDPFGVVIFRENIQDPSQVRELNASIREACPSGRVLIAVDQEGGRVARLREGVPTLPPMRDLAESGDFLRLRNAGMELGQALRSLGFDVDFAPVLDVDSNPDNPIIGDRSFSSDPHQVGPLAMAFAEGLIEAGILPCGKHFPGHGDTDLDSHVDLPFVHAALKTLENRELLPFNYAISRKMPLMMTAHVIYPALDKDRPATLSRTIITGLLRERMGFDGLILSDDLLMDAVARTGVVNAAIGALNAGCDGLLVLRNQPMALEVFDALEKHWTAQEDSVVEAVKRVDQWSQTYMAGRLN